MLFASWVPARASERASAEAHITRFGLHRERMIALVNEVPISCFLSITLLSYFVHQVASYLSERINDPRSEYVVSIRQSWPHVQAAAPSQTKLRRGWARYCWFCIAPTSQGEVCKFPAVEHLNLFVVGFLLGGRGQSSEK
jgi:hypothetical protein